MDRRSQGQVVDSQDRAPDAEGNQGAELVACSNPAAVDMRAVDN